VKDIYHSPYRTGMIQTAWRDEKTAGNLPCQHNNVIRLSDIVICQHCLRSFRVPEECEREN
jgi:hypothetical protein